MNVHRVCEFDDNCLEEASTLGIEPERSVRPFETTEFHYKGRKAMAWRDVRNPGSFLTSDIRTYQQSKAVSSDCLPPSSPAPGAVPLFEKVHASEGIPFCECLRYDEDCDIKR